MKKVSVVVPCFNATAYLDNCMEHLLCQTIGPDSLEIILVDDASTDSDATWNMIMRYEQQYPETIIAIQLEKNLRQGGARNVGISYASGRYLFFCDADDWIAPHALEHLYTVAMEYNADVVEFRHEIVWQLPDQKEVRMEAKQHYAAGKEIPIRKNCLREIKTEEDRRGIVYQTDEYYTLGCWNKMYRLSMIQEHNIRFAEQLICEEPSFTLPVRYYVERHCLLDEVLYYYYQSPGSTVRSKWGARRWDSSKVWLHTYEELSERNLISICYQELAYLFVLYYMGMSLSIWCQQGTEILQDELVILQDTLFKLFPDILSNQYWKRDNTWNQILFSILQIEITQESTTMINQILKKHLLGE